MPLDRDLASMQEVRDLVGRAVSAQQQMMGLDQAAIDRIVEAMAEAGYRASAQLGQIAWEETTYGNPGDKRVKNEFGSRTIGEAIRGMRTIGYLGEQPATRIREFAWPYGVIGAITPTTNPTSTIMYKAIIAVKSGNALVASPHPHAVRSSCAAMDVVARAAEAAGLPSGALGCISQPTMAGTQELMRHPQVDLILATGGKEMVKAAYSSGKPAYGVGPGNVPVYVDQSADIATAARRIIQGKTFDWGTLCSSEQCIVADRPIADALRRALEEAGGYFLSPDQKRAVEQVLMEPSGRVNVKLIGHPPQAIAEAAGFRVESQVRALIAPIDEVGRREPLSLEKLSPVLAFTVREGWEAGCHTCIDLLHVGGEGHTLGLYCQDEQIIMEFGLKKPVFRICVNTPTSIGAVGVTTGLFPAMTLGCGAPGGNITSDNIGPQHLYNKKRLAFHLRDVAPPAATAPSAMVPGRPGSGGGYSAVTACSPLHPTGCDTSSFHGLTERDIEAILAQMAGGRR